MLRLTHSTRTPDFASGDAFICDGIAFFIRPDNTDLVYAASPTSVFDDQRMNLIVAEVIRVLPNFLLDYPHLHAVLRGRKLCVRMIESYTAIQSDFRREQKLEWNIIDAVLSDVIEVAPNEP